ncbi:MAG: hypothetical protein P4L69_17575 [Desulfosporosinus sp.]|nr:hypothetical protein [Desulfosporosinus sp.]
MTEKAAGAPRQGLNPDVAYQATRAEISGYGSGVVRLQAPAWLDRAEWQANFENFSLQLGKNPASGEFSYKH